MHDGLILPVILVVMGLGMGHTGQHLNFAHNSKGPYKVDIYDGKWCPRPPARWPLYDLMADKLDVVRPKLLIPAVAQSAMEAIAVTTGAKSVVSGEKCSS